MGERPEDSESLLLELKIFRSETTTVVYQLGGVPGSVQVQGWNGRILENDSSRRPFQRRRSRAVQGISGAILAGAALAIWYRGRHSFFRPTPNYGLLWVLALVLGLCIVPLVLWWVLPAERRSRKGAVVAGLPALLVALTQAGLGCRERKIMRVYARPSARRSRFTSFTSGAMEDWEARVNRPNAEPSASR